MASVVEICNLALGWLAANPITSEELNTQSSVEAKLCAINYPLLRDSVLEARAWTFATRRQKLAPLASTDPDYMFGYGSKFPLPSTCIRVMRASRIPSLDDRLYWVREGDYILADSDTLYIKFIYREVDTGRYTPAFVQTLAARMASDLAIALTENAKLQELMFTMYKDKLFEAAATDGTQGKQERIRSDALTRVRLSNYVSPVMGPYI